MAEEKKGAAPTSGADTKAAAPPRLEGPKVKAPEGHGVVSVGGQTFEAAEDGFFYVPEHLVKHLQVHFSGIEKSIEAEAKRVEHALMRRLEETGAVDMAKRLLGR